MYEASSEVSWRRGAAIRYAGKLRPAPTNEIHTCPD
jgi:hypothetical protein